MESRFCSSRARIWVLCQRDAEAISILWLVTVLLLITGGPLSISGQTGVSVDLSGLRLPNDSFVAFDDIPDLTPTDGVESFDVLNCRTDLVACCNAGLQMLPANVGAWYYPNGTELQFDTDPLGGTIFRRNRLLRNVRLWRRGSPPERGRFYCELPDAQNVNHTNYVNILDIGAVSVSSAGTTTRTVGENFNLQCSADITPNPLPENVPTPSFEWFFGSNNVTLPSGVTVSSVTTRGNTYTSTLQFSPLQESHAGMYTCRLGGNVRLANNAMITVNRPTIIVIISQTGSQVLGENDYILTCDVFGDENLMPTVTYQWTRDNGTIETIGTNSRTLSFSPLSLSDAGRYTCHVNVSSPYLSSDVTVSSGNPQTVMFQIPNSSVAVASVPSTPIPVGTNVFLTCTVELGPSVTESDLPLLMVDAHLSRNGNTVMQAGLAVTGTTFTYIFLVGSFGNDDSGMYNCTATVSLCVSSTYLTGISVQSGSAELGSYMPSTSDHDSPDTITCPSAMLGAVTTCNNEIAISVIASILIEFLLGTPIIIVVVVLCWRRRRKQMESKSYNEVSPVHVSIGDEAVYEDPENVTSGRRGRFELIACPAYELSNNQPKVPIVDQDLYDN